MSEYTQGICQNGAAILKDGQALTVEEILQHLRERDLARRDYEVMNKLREGAEQEANQSAIKALVLLRNEFYVVGGSPFRKELCLRIDNHIEKLRQQELEVQS